MKKTLLNGWFLVVCEERNMSFLYKCRLPCEEISLSLGNEPFSTAERSEFKIFFFAQRTNTRSRHRAGDRCHAMPWRQQSRTAQARGDRMTRHHAEDQQLYNRMYLTSRAHRGSLSKRRELVLSSLPTPFFFFADSRPRSLKLCVSFPCICSPPVCIIRSVTSLSLATTTWTPEHPFFSTHCYLNTSSDITCVLGGGSFLVTAHGFSSKGVVAVRARRLFPSTISGVSLTSGSKIRLTAGFEPRPQGPAPSSLAAAHSPF